MTWALLSPKKTKGHLVLVLNAHLAEGRRDVLWTRIKSNVGDEFVDLITMLDAFWRIVEFPPDVRPV